ncbi:MAG: DUF302 domain-containing protein [Bacteroidales bacterium]|jgi:uncharacterized protein (DUF302 family)|nr:DUF302 domain-containing protein [Bacteroidales bacterium]
MSYYITKITEGNFNETLEKVTEALKDVGFGVITEVNMKEKLKEKLDVDFKQYVILGACNPGFAYEAVQMEEELGVLLPCNVVVIDKEDGRVQVSAIDAAKMMSVVGNPELDKIAKTVNERLGQALNNL